MASEINIGTGGFGTLTIVFIVLKLCDVIDWSWWWVLAPTWIPAAIAIIIFVIILLEMAIFILMN